MATGNGARYAGVEKSPRGGRNGSRQKARASGNVSNTLLAKLQDKYPTKKKPTVATNQKVEHEAQIESESYVCLNPACKRVFPSNAAYGTHADGKTCCKTCEDIVDPYSAEIRRQRALS